MDALRRSIQLSSASARSVLIQTLSELDSTLLDPFEKPASKIEKKIERSFPIWTLSEFDLDFSGL